MAGVFISYRRDDSKGFAGALMRDLDRRLGAEQVFMDIEDIQGGTDFPAVLRRAVQSSDVLLALIGSRWLEARDAQGNRRLDDPSDFVRQEIALALQSGSRVIPVLVDGARMPTEEQLPADLRPVATLNALELTNSHWDEDVARLTDHIREGLYFLGTERAATAPIAPDFSPIPPMSGRVKLFTFATLGLGLLFAAVGAGLGVGQHRYEATSTAAEAEVVRMLQETTDDNGIAYRPELQYVTAEGQVVRFTSRTASAPPSYQLGEKVLVLYDPASPEQAVVDTFAERWLLTLIFAGLGLVGLMIGAAPLAVRTLRRRQLRRLLDKGRPIVTAFHSVEENAGITLQGRHPYVVVTEWRNPVSKELVHFRSHQVWDDPTEKASKRLITVVVDPDSFDHYLMDLSFLKGGPRPQARDL